MSSNGLCGGNEPVGAWKYADGGELGIDKYCGIFKTVGDFRLGTNLYQGLKMIIDKEIDALTFTHALEDMKLNFELMNRLKDGIPVPTWHLKIVRSHKIGDIQRNVETKRAWFTEGEKHLDFI